MTLPRQLCSGNAVEIIGAQSTDTTEIPNHPGDMPEGTLRVILREAGIDPNDFPNVK
jgi:hypothetical protein